MQEKAEIRRILLGKTVWTADGRLAARERGRLALPQGVVNGSGAVRFFGLSRRQRSYRLPDKLPRDRIEQLLCGIGRAVALAQAPGVCACLCRNAVMDPVLLRVEQNEAALQVTAFTGRTPWAGLLCRRALDALEQELPEGAERIEEEVQKQSAPRKKAAKEDAPQKKRAPREKPARKEGKKGAKGGRHLKR